VDQDPRLFLEVPIGGMNSYYAYVRALPGRILLGGVREHRSSRFGSKQDAQARLDQIMEANGGTPCCSGGIVYSPKPPELFRHCPDSDLGAIGGHCPKCHKFLTVQDAISHISG